MVNFHGGEFMENAILRVLKKDQEAQEKLSTLENLSEEYKEKIEQKQVQIKKEIWDHAYQYVAEEKEKLHSDLKDGESINEKQSVELLQQLEEKFMAGRAKWEEELITKVTLLEDERDVL